MSNSIGEELKDKVNGKVVNWNEKKQANQYFLQVIKPIFKDIYGVDQFEKENEELKKRIDELKEKLMNLAKENVIKAYGKGYLKFVFNNKKTFEERMNELDFLIRNLDDCQIIKLDDYRAIKEELKDVSDKLSRNFELEESVQMNYEKMLDRVDNCAQVLKHYRDTDGNMRLYQAWFCKNRFCPMCAWRKSLKDSFILSQALNEFKKQYPKARLLFVTLTLNDTGVYDSESIRERISELKNSVSKMFRDKRIKGYVLGLVKSLELTVKLDEHSDTGLRFHVHLHLMVGVKSNYFSKGYLSKMEWVKLWRASVGVNYDPSVNVKAIKPKETGKAVQELSKYMVKSSDYLRGDEKDTKTLEILMTGLKGVQSVSYTGEFRKIKARIKADEDDLIHLSGKESGKQTIQFVYSRYNNGRKKYYVYDVSDWKIVDFDVENELGKLVKNEVSMKHGKIRDRKKIKISAGCSVVPDSDTGKRKDNT